MEQKRQEAVQRLGELSKIKFGTPTARELHSSRPMLTRVRHQEMKRYQQSVMAKKAKLTKEISDIDRYLQSVSDYDKYIARLPKKKKEKGDFQLTVQPPLVLSEPDVVIGRRPVLRKTRLPRYVQRKGRRGNY